jgi:TPR repeat protein
MIARLVCAVTFGALMVSGAYAASGDDAYARAIEQYEAGHYATALDGFRDAARGGHLRAQEVAALMVLTGPSLYGPSVGVDRVAGIALLSRAAESGSDIARYVLCGNKYVGREQRRINCLGD